jgi:hypothetical protein
MKVKLLIGVLFAVHLALSLFHLNHTTMWDDEASVVWFAKNYNKYHQIVGYDGSNIFSYRNGQLINDQLVYNNPPLDIYYTSYIIKYIGDDDFTVRMAFLVLGWIALIFYLLGFKILLKKDPKWFVYSSVLLLLSVNYLLIEANSRYYSLNFLFGAISLWATLKITHFPMRRMGGKVFFLIVQLTAIYFLFLSHYLAGLCWWLMCFFILLQHKQVKISLKDKFTWIAFVLNTALLIITAKYFIAHQALNRPDMLNEDSLFVKYFKLLGWLLNDLNRANIIPLWSVLLFIFLAVFKRKALNPEFRKMALFSLVFIGASYLLNPQSTSRSTCFDLRYIYPIIPILYMWVGYLFKLLHENFNKGKYWALVLVFIYINSTILCYIPESTPPRLLLPNFIKERIQPYPTAYSASIDYINKNFTSRKKILTIPGFHNTVFLRYVPDKIEITNTLDEQTPLSKSKIDSLGMGCLFIGRCKPEYIFLFGNYGDLNAYPYSPKDYKYIDTIPVFASGIDITRPELFWHSFGPKTDINLQKDALYILHD